jgi:hypothetical protein
MSLKAVRYAEEELGVHDIWKEARNDLTEYRTATESLAKALSARRSVEDQIQDAEGMLISDKRGKHPDMSEAAFSRQLSTWKRQDQVLSGLRDKLADSHALVQGLQFEVDILKASVRLKSARLEELGGYLNYLAAVKQAEKNTQPKEDNQS